MKNLKAFTLMAFLCGTITLTAQQTVGLFQNTADSYNGYTLFAPLGSMTTYLIDNCGELVQSWTTSYRPGQAVYLLEDGTLLRTGNTGNTTFTAGGTGGIIEMIDWDGNVIWDYTISSTTECQHHDIEYLPNGNILAVVWDSYTSAEAEAAGRTTSGTTLWSDKIVEIEPDLVNGGGTVVWEWKAWDHLVQDENAATDNYGNVADSPQLIDLNYVLSSATNADWLHINSVDYNADLDQIILSNHNFSEIWIIDHSTTTLEASGHTGGNSGMGGDLLYRWGNPRTYDQGDDDDQMLFLQHDAKWIEEDFTDGGMIMIFNNRAGTLSGLDYSAVNVIDPPVDASGNYTYSGTAYEPTDFHWTYEASDPTDFYGENISGATRLPNGNTLVCEGPTGTFFEVDYSGNTVWEYVNPVSGSGIIAQYSSASNNRAFRAERYSTDYSGFTGQTLTPQGYIETGSTFDCDLFTTTAVHEIIDGEEIGFNIYPNPAQNDITVMADVELTNVSIYNLAGQQMDEIDQIFQSTNLNVNQLPNGMYFIKAITSDSKVVTQKMIVEK